MALNWPTFFKRLGSSIVFVAIMLTGLLWNEWSFLGLVVLIGMLCLRDYFRLVQKIDTASYWPKWLPITAQLLALAIICLFSNKVNELLPAYGRIVFMLLPIVPAILLLGSVLSKKNSLFPLLQSTGGLMYITLPMLLLLNIHTYDTALPIAVILMIWCNDTMAYLVGSFIGKHQFSPISPKKTWEGVIGGAVLTIAGAGVYGYYSETYRFIDWMALALCVTIAGTLGDLMESKLKRMADIKDSGTLMPGHGGALDRFDSLLVAAPFAFVYSYYFMR